MLLAVERDHELLGRDPIRPQALPLRVRPQAPRPPLRAARVVKPNTFNPNHQAICGTKNEAPSANRAVARVPSRSARGTPSAAATAGSA